MSRGQWAALAGIAVLLAGAFAVRADADRDAAAREAAARAAAGATPSASPTPDPRLDGLRAAAGLEPCPAGLGSELPDMVLACLGGGPDVVVRAGATGRPTLVNVWGTWCAPCVKEVPDLREFSERAGDRVGLVGVLTQDTETNGLEFARQFGMRWPSLVDPLGDFFRAVRPGPPVTLFVDPQGRVVHRKSGPFDDVAEIERLVEEHLGVAL